jgi:transposase
MIPEEILANLWRDKQGENLGLFVARHNRANELTAMARDAIGELWDLLCDLDPRIESFDNKIEAVFKASAACQRVAKVNGVGPKTATAIVAAVGDTAEFKNGWHMAAWLGLVPRQHSSGDRKVLMGISNGATSICPACWSMAPVLSCG